MVELNFRGFLPTEEKPEFFELFREKTSELLKDLDGVIPFDFVGNYQQFDITKNTTDKTFSEIRKILGKYSKYII